ncbi:MAG: extracellular solute-binding protein [Thermotaleaceae bacterium]
MKNRKLGPFNLFLIFLLWGFVVFGPIYFFLCKPTPDYLQEKEDSNWKGVITLWDYPRLDNSNGSRYGWITSKIKEFERENPGVYIELKALDWYTGAIELETAVQTGEVPDIAPVAGNYTFTSKGVLESVDAYMTREEVSDYRTQALSAVRYNGKTWGFPWMMTTHTLLLNTERFREKGVDLPKDGNWTYEEFIETLKALTYDKDGDGKKDGFGFNSFIDNQAYNLWGILLSDGGEIFDDENLIYRFYDERARKGLQKLVDLKQLHQVVPDNFGENTENEAWQSFYKDKTVAVYPAGTWTVNVLNRLKQQGAGFEFAVANYPIGEKGVPVTVSANVSAYGIFKQEDPEKLAMCVAFLKFITQEKYQKELYRLGVFPVKKSAGDIYEKDPIMSIIEKSLPYTQNPPSHSQWTAIDEILQSQIRQAVLGKKTVEEAIADAEEKIKTFLTLKENEDRAKQQKIED